MTIQDKNDNVLAMFRYGKNRAVQAHGIEILSNSKYRSLIRPDSNYSWETEKIIAHQLKYITINDPFNNLPPVSDPALRVDAMSNYPFCNRENSQNYLSVRSWGFNKQIESSYIDFYRTAGYGNVYSYVFVNSISNTMETRFPSEINESNLYPKESNFSSIPISVGFNLFGVGSVGYTIDVPYKGVKKTWDLMNTFNINHNIEPYNYGKFTAFPYSTFTWRDGYLFWPTTVYDAISNDAPNSSYGGFYSRFAMSIYASGDYLYALYSSDIDYGIKVISTSYKTIDYYYISVEETFPYLNLVR